MKVKDLLQSLMEADPEAIVIGPSSNFELRGRKVAASRVFHSEQYRRDEGFRDAFDGTAYDTEIFSHASPGQKVSVVEIYF